MKKIYLSLLFFLFIGFNSYAQWTQTNGPVGGTVSCLTNDGTNLYAGTQGSGVFYSSNSGTSWTQEINGLNSTYINAMVISGSTVFAGGSSGLFSSTNNGASWTNLSSGISSSEPIMSLAANGSNIFAGTNGDGVYYSSNGGSTWTQSNTGLPAGQEITALAINGNTIFAGTIGNGIYLSTNNGASWTAVNTGLTGYSGQTVYSIVVKGSNIFATINAYGVFLSTNNGTSWSSVNSGLPNLFLFSMAVNGADLFAATQNNGVYLSTNNGTSWTAANGGISTLPVYAVTIMGADIFCGTSGSGVYLTSNNGVSWSSSSVGLIATNVKALAFNGTDLFAGVFQTGLSLTSSGGIAWSPLVTAGSNNFFNSFVVGNGNVFASTYGSGVFLSLDNGETWTQVNTGLTGQELYVNALAISGTNTFAGTANQGVFISTNNGTSWTQVNSGLTNLDVTSLAVNGSDIFVGTNGGVFLSTNNGTSWTAVNSGLTTLFVSSLFVNGSSIFAGTQGGGVFMSTNNGTSWTAVNTGLPTGYNFTSFAVSGSAIFVTASPGNVFLTTNNGTSWTSVTSNLPYLSFNALAINGNTIYLGSDGEGVWKRQIPEIICSLNPPVMTSISSTAICSGSTLNIALTSSGVSASYNWLASANPQATGESTTTQSTSTINNTIINTSNSSSTNVSYTVTPIGISGGCYGTPETITVTVNPLPVMTSNSTLTICSGQAVGLALTSTVASSYSWIAGDNPHTTGESTSAQSSGTVNDVIVNTSLVPQTVTYTITPTSSAGTCAGASQTLLVTVNPTPTMTSASSASICSGATVNINLTSNVAASYVWIGSANPNTTGESTTFQSTGALSNTVVNNTTSSQIVTYTITPTAIVGGCAGSQLFTLTVKPTPTMTSASSASICSGGVVSIPLTSNILSSFVWNATSDNPNTSGESLTPQSSDTLKNTLINNSDIIQTVYYSVTPISTAGTCTGTIQSVAVTVNPSPTMTSSNAATMCSGGTVNIPLTSNVTSSYNWVATLNSNTTGESTTNQSTDILNNTIVNNSSSPQDVVYTVIPTAMIGGCAGSAQTVTVLVNPVPVMSSTATATICSGIALNIPLTANASSSFLWIAADNINTTGESTSYQDGNTLDNTIINNSASTQEVIYSVTPTSTSGNCAGMPQTVAITVNPAPVMINSSNTSICSEVKLNFPLISNISSSFSWIAASNPNANGESTTAQTSNSINDSLINKTNTVQDVVYTITPTSLAGGCVGGSQEISVLLNPLDNASFNYSSGTFCQSGSDPSALVTGVPGGAFSSTAGLVFLNPNNGLINLSSSALGEYTITYTTNGTCPNSSVFKLSITSAPSALFSYQGTPYCSNAGNPLPTLGNGSSAGIFSANPSGLSFVSTLTGEIDLSASAPGKYAITNTIASSGGMCK